jgi:signal transduction histidine kinase
MEEEKLEVTGLRNPDFWKDYYTNVQWQIERINNLLKDLWTASEKPSAQFPDRVALRDAVAATVTAMSDSFAAKKIEVENQIPDTLPPLNVDGPKFTRLFELLFKDEIASLPTGSRLTLTAHLVDGGPKPEIALQISDNGPGLPQEALRVLFDPFVVRSDTPAEYGIHLMACYFIVYHHGGKIEAKSQQGQGTTFTLRLPLHPERAVSTNGDREFLQKVLLNETLWERLISSD